MQPQQGQQQMPQQYPPMQGNGYPQR
jgi:hypothetical protein